MPLRSLSDLAKDSFRVSDHHERRDLAVSSARLALRAYVGTAHAIHGSLHLAEAATSDDDRAIKDANLGARYRDAAFETIIHFQHFAELVVKEVLRRDHELLVTVTGKDHELLHGLLHGTPPAASAEATAQAIEASLALERACALLGKGLLDPAYEFIRRRKPFLETLNGLRNRLWHRGQLVLRYAALDELVGAHALPFFRETTASPLYAGIGSTWMHKPLRCGLDPLALIEAEFRSPTWSLGKVAFLKELARAAYENPLEQEPVFFAEDNDRLARRAEAAANQFPTHEVESVDACPVCGMRALVVYITSDTYEDESGSERMWSGTYLARCEGCTLELREEYGNASTHGLTGISDYWRRW